MEEKKNDLGNIYGSRISKNGKWLNLIVAVKDNKITIPIKLGETQDKPFALVKDIETLDGENLKRAVVLNIPVYEDKPKQEQEAPKDEDGLPF